MARFWGKIMKKQRIISDTVTEAEPLYTNLDFEQVVQQLRDEGDEKIHYLQLAQCQAWELNLNHTVSTAYASRGEVIIEKIRSITGW